MLVLLARTQLFFYSFLFSVITYSAVNKSEFLKKSQFYGTEKRREFEYKFAVDLKDTESISIRDLSQKINIAIKNLINNKEFLFSKQIFTSYSLSKDFQSFVFKDFYLDTPDLLVHDSNSAYRLRYRWVRQEKYYRHLLFPFLTFFHPDRCEIQFKGGYKRNNEFGHIEVQETRFEFRDESSPFLNVENLNAPPSPWPKETFLKYALTGEFLNFPILPMRDLLKTLPKSSREKINLQPIMEVTTERFRTHLNIPSPWGIGPNPEQAFIITIDLVSAKSLTRSKKSISKRLIEVEIEIDRNISTEIDRVSNLTIEPTNIQFSAKKFSSLARKNLHLDLFKLKNNIAEILKNEYRLQALPVTNKYSRLIHMDFFK